MISSSSLIRSFKNLFDKGLNCPSILYHGVYETGPEYLLKEKFHNVSPQHFRSQLVELKRKRTPVFLDELVDLVNQKKRTDKVFTVSFDDGYTSINEHALPILMELNIPTTLFVNAGFASSPFWRDGIRLLLNNNLEQQFSGWMYDTQKIKLPSGKLEFYKYTKKSGKSAAIAKGIHTFLSQHIPDAYALAKKQFMEIADWPQSDLLMLGNHTRDHYVLADLSRAEQWEQIESNHSALKESGAHVSQCFSIPFGNPASFNQDTLDIVHDLGYKAILTSSGYRVSGFETEMQNLDTHGLVVGNRFMPRDNHKIVLKKTL